MEKRTMAVNVKNENIILKRLLLRKSSELYMCKNVGTIQKELARYGVNIKKEKINSFLLSMRSSGQILNNHSRGKIGQISRSFILLPCYFAVMHSDILFLSKNRKYGTLIYKTLNGGNRSMVV